MLKWGKAALATVFCVLAFCACAGAADWKKQDKEPDAGKREEETENKANEAAKAALLYAKSLGAGINIGNSLDAHGNSGFSDIMEYETRWENPVVTPELMQLISESGFSTVRIPVTWQEHMDETGTINPAWLKRVGTVADAALLEGLSVILDVHHDSWYLPVYDNLPQALLKTETVWGQIAAYFKGYDERLVFEGFNEPRLAGTPEEWGNGTPEAYDVINQLNECFVKTVRESGGANKKRWLLIASYRNGCGKEMLDALEPPQDSRLLLSVHMYVPQEFVQKKEGPADWSAENPMDTALLDEAFSAIETFCAESRIPAVITEFGAVDKGNESAREAWCSYFVGKAKAAGMPYLWWDNHYPLGDAEGFAILDRKNNRVVYPGIAEILTGEASHGEIR